VVKYGQIQYAFLKGIDEDGSCNGFFRESGMVGAR